MLCEEKPPIIVLGTMTLGKEVDEATAEKMVDFFLNQAQVEIDTAYGYSEGRSEEILGKILYSARRKKVKLATKVNPWSEFGLQPERVIQQVETSLTRLKTDHIDLLYIHSPDLKTPIELTLRACQKLHQEGKFKELGLSNYAAWQVVHIWHICKKNGWVLPTVYQGMYNGITRDVERELFPALRELGIRFYAYNPLAGGLLTGKHMRQKVGPVEGRFTLYPGYKERYWKEAQFHALEIIRLACDMNNLTMTEAALRWIKHHSFLKGTKYDGVTVGATNIEQLKENFEGYSGGKLPNGIVNAFNLAWESARPACPQYFRT